MPFCLMAQTIYSNTLTTINYLDSVNIKKYKRKIDTNRITIEPNRVTGIASFYSCLLYTSPSPRDGLLSRMPSSA